MAAINTTYTATIKGRTYTNGTYFVVNADVTGRGDSQGNGSYTSLSRGQGAYFIMMAYSTQSGVNVYYPYAIGTSSSYANGWFTADAFPPATYGIYYNANGGSGAPGAQTKYWNSNLALSGTKPWRTGYTFQRWNTNSSGTGTNYYPGGTYSANAGVTLYAIWSIIQYTISYNANGGTGAPGSQIKNYGSNITISSTKPTRTGYDFLGWATSSDGGVVYSPGATYSSNANATLYAVWKLKEYNIIFNANGGTDAPAAITKQYGIDVTLTGKPFRKNYDFLGWSKTPTGSVEYEENATFSENESMTLYAVWKLSYIRPTITGLNIYRCDDSGNELNDGTDIFVEFDFTIDATLRAGRLRRIGVDINGTNVNITEGNNPTSPNFSNLTKRVLVYNESVSPVSIQANIVSPDGTTTPDMVEDPTTGVSYNRIFEPEMDIANKEYYSQYTIIAGHYSFKTSNGGYSVERTHNVSVLLEDVIEIDVNGAIEYGNATGSKQVLQSFFTMDFLAGGKGVAMGRAATHEYQFDCDLKTNFFRPFMFENNNVRNESASSLFLLPNNVISTTEEDTPDNWAAIGSGYSYYENMVLNDQPGTGVLMNRVAYIDKKEEGNLLQRTHKVFQTFIRDDNISFTRIGSNNEWFVGNDGLIWYSHIVEITPKLRYVDYNYGNLTFGDGGWLYFPDHPPVDKIAAATIQHYGAVSTGDSFSIFLYGSPGLAGTAGATVTAVVIRYLLIE